MKIRKQTINLSIYIFTGVLVVVALVIVVATRSKSSQTSASTSTTVTEENGAQIISMKVKGGYSPANIEAKSGKPTILRMKTSNTFDCSSYVVISSLGVEKALPPSGTTDITIPAQKSGAVIKGSCGMGMYDFEIKFT